MLVLENGLPTVGVAFSLCHCPKKVPLLLGLDPKRQLPAPHLAPVLESMLFRSHNNPKHLEQENVFAQPNCGFTGASSRLRSIELENV